MPLHNIRSIKGVGSYAVYRIATGACWQCPQRAQCTKSTSPAFRREFSVPLSGAALAQRVQILARARATAGVDSPGFVKAPIGPAPAKPSAPPPLPLRRWTTPQAYPAGPMLFAAPALRPNVLLNI